MSYQGLQPKVKRVRNVAGSALRVQTDDAQALELGTNGSAVITISGAGVAQIASSNIVTASSTDTLLNKTVVSSTAAVTGALTLPSGTAAQRPTPAAGMTRLNTDSNEFEGYANGAWQSIGGGLNEQPVKNYLKTYATAAVAPGTLSTLASATANLVSLAAFYADSTSGSAALTQSTSTALRGPFNYLTVLSGAALAGTTFFQFPAFALESSDLGKPISLSFDVTGSTLFSDWDVVVVRYNSSGVHQEILPVAGTVASSSATPPSSGLPTGTSTFNGLFVSGSTAGDLYAVRPRRLANAVNIRLDTLFAGNQPIRLGAAVTDPIAFTPSTTQGFGTISSNALTYRRVGAFMHISGRFTTGTVDASEARIGLPSGLVIGDQLGAGIGLITGRWHRNLATASTRKRGTIIMAPGNAYVTFATDDYTAAVGPGSSQLGNSIFNNTELLWIDAYVPISGWSSNQTSADRAVEEYSSNSSTATTGDETTLFVNGASGSLIAAITSGGKRRVRFPTPILATDGMITEVDLDGTGRWSPVGAIQNSTSRAVDIYTVQNTVSYGISQPSAANSTDADVFFGTYRSTRDSTSWGGAGSAWSTVSGSARWRVRKVASGAQIGGAIGARNVVGDVTGTTVPTGYIGERIKNSQTTFTNCNATTNSTEVISQAFTAGVWDISAHCNIKANGATVTDNVLLAITTTSGNNLTGAVAGESYLVGMIPSGNSVAAISITSCRFVFTATTTVYFKVRADYSAGTPQWVGQITGTRVG